MIYELVSERKAPAYRIASPADAYKPLARYARSRTERFLTISLDSAHQVISVRIVSIGSVNRTIAVARDVFYPAVKDSAVAIVAAHSHPSGSLIFSEEDLAVSRRLREAGDILGITLLDSLVISKHGFASMVMQGLLPPSTTD